MATPHKLSSKEVAALVGGLIHGFDDDTHEEGAEVRSYKFGTNDMSLLGDYYGLRMINERFCRIARSVFLPMLRIQPRISAFPPEIKKFSEYSDELENFVSLTISRIEELRGNHMVVMHPTFVSLLTDSYYGGTITNEPNRRAEFTSTENRVIEIVSRGVLDALELAWRDLSPISFDVVNREENLQFASFCDADDMVVNCSFLVQLPEADPATVDILYPLQTLKPISSQLRSRMQSDVIGNDLSWKQRLVHALLDVPLEVTAHLAEPTVRMGTLTAIQPGNIVPVNIWPHPKLLIEGQLMYEGDLGELAGHAAISITGEITP
ncbi:MAG: flagellar motor switch protein FliM, partial [Pseudomonadota bacterium]|nr:flagellar motor switch protein FliM [Pseudomonadota bacterium]